MVRFLVAPILLALAVLPSIAGEKPPNVVFIISDDQGWTDYGFMGHQHVQTPNLDKLASQSLTFTRGYVPSSLCCPSLASLITGRYPHQHKVTSNDPPNPRNLSGAEFQKSAEFLDGREAMTKHLEAVPTLPRELAKAGYLSFQSGKWWQGDFSRGGFTHGMTKGNRHGDAGLDIGRKTMQPISDFLAIAKKEDKPFFLWYAPMMPHTPHNPPERFLTKYKDKTPSVHVAKYWAMIEWFDETCGQLLDTLEKEKLAENTIVIYLADNGWTQDPAKGDSIRSKRTPYDAGLRTPILVKWPNEVKPAASDEPMSSIDIMTTILPAVGLKSPKDLDGVNLLAEDRPKRDRVSGACFAHNAVDLNNPAKNLEARWMVLGDWKLIVPVKGEPELYDLKDDPAELKNLAAMKPDAVKRLAIALDDWWKPGL